MGTPPPQLPFVDAAYRCLTHKLSPHPPPPLISTTSHNCPAAARCYSYYYSYYYTPPLFSSLSAPTSIKSQIVRNIRRRRRRRKRRRSLTAAAVLPLPESRQPPDENNNDDDQEEEEEEEEALGLGSLSGNYWGGGGTNSIVWACVVGVLTGVSVVLFNNGVHELRDFFWDGGGIPYRGASWLREQPLSSIWRTRVILAPACGGLAVTILNAIRSSLPQAIIPNNNNNNNNKAAAAVSTLLLEPLLKATAACFTLGTGNSLGPEGPNVEIGASIAKAITSFTSTPNSKIIINPQTNFSLLAAGSAAGISSGFNAAVAGCFFAVESVLWPSPPADSSTSLTNATSMVILSAVIASVVSEVGLGSEPAFKVPVYDFRSFGELPLYLLLGVLCGFISLTLSRCTSTILSFVNNLHNSTGIPRTVFPVLGGFTTGIIALAYPEVLYWGFENVDILLESRPFVNGLSAQLLLQLVGIKILATSLCRASGLVGGYYTPSLFIGAATGMAYGKLINFALAQSSPVFQLSIFEVASPQAYGLVGMAATLAGVCQVPLTSVLLLFELTQDYRIVLPLLGAVGMSSWITSRQTKTNIKETTKLGAKCTSSSGQTELSSSEPTGLSSGGSYDGNKNSLCEVESSLCVDDSIMESRLLKGKVCVSAAMKTRYVTVLMRTSLMEVVTLMLAEKQSCAMIVDEGNILIGLLTLGHIADFSKLTKGKKMKPRELLVSEMCASDDHNCRVPWTANPGMDILSVRVIMDNYGLNQVPVVSDQNGRPVGLIDRECISVTCRALVTRESLK